MSEKKTVADYIFGAKDTVEKNVKKVVDKCDETVTKTINKTNKYTEKLQDKYEENSKKAQKQFDKGFKSASKMTNTAFNKANNIKDNMLAKLGFDKYKKEYTYGTIGENNFETSKTVNEEERLFKDLSTHLKLDKNLDPNKLEVLEKYVKKEIPEGYIKNTYNIASIADNVIRTREDIDLQLKKDIILSIEYDKLNQITMFLNGNKKTNCIEVGMLLDPEEKSPGIDDVITKNSVRLEGEAVPKSPMEILQEMMTKLQQQNQ